MSTRIALVGCSVVESEALRTRLLPHFTLVEPGWQEVAIVGSEAKEPVAGPVIRLVAEVADDGDAAAITLADLHLLPLLIRRELRLHRAEQALRDLSMQRERRETQLRIAQELAHLGTWEWDLVTGLAIGSRELFLMAGFGDGPRVGTFDDAFSIVHPDDVAALDAGLRRAVEERTLFEQEYRVVRHDGSEVIVHSRGQLVFDSAGNPLRMIGMAQDITERKTTERAMRETEERYRSLVAYIPEVTWRGNARRKPLFVSPNVQRLWGYTAEELLEGGIELWATKIHPADRDRVLRAYRALFERGGTEYDVEYRFQRKDRAWMWVHDRAEVAEVEGAAQAFGVMSDVTARRFAEEALRKSEASYRALVEQATDVIFTVDIDGNITSLNRAFATVTAWPIDSWIGRDFRELLQPESLPTARRHLRAVLRGESYCADYAVRARDGRMLEMETTAQALVVDGRVAGTVGIARDVTRRKEQEAQNEKEKRLASLGQLAASVAHEFNNVLMSILPFAELIKRRVSGDERITLATRHIFQAIARGRQVSQEILRLTRPAPATLSALDLRDWMADFGREASEMLGPKYRVLARVDVEGAVFVRADRALLDQVATNLVLNARDAMPDGGPVAILASRCNADETIEIDVIDGGHGIPENLLERIFDPLFTTKRGGTGLGLSIAHEAMARQGGSVSVKSRVGEGSTFTMCLRETAAPPAVSAAPERPLEPQRVLLVEDDEAVGEGIRALLEDEGFEVLLVARGGEAMPAVDTFGPDVVVLDVNLPDISGLDVFELLAASAPHLPVIFSTGHADARALDDVHRRGVPSIMKPYDIADLVTLIHDAVSTESVC
ncbi:MAG TPA: PAS domain S-box protein [Thermoanaerobaculia bacterium]|jgi:PAS domain S-box-containing protein|nr:PAS domain S-box protein [Thermoanaerobaculia bacterium]